MGTRFTQLQCKEVICVSDGQRLGFICDVVAAIPEGNIEAIVVPGPCQFWNPMSRKEEYVIPWHCICRIGPDTVLVDICPKDCRFPRPKMRFPF